MLWVEGVNHWNRNGLGAIDRWIRFNNNFGQGGFGNVTVLRSSDVVAAIDLFLVGQMDTAGLEAWAERREMSEDVEYAAPDREAVAEALFQLANPAINGALTLDRVRQVRVVLVGGNPDTDSGPAPDGSGI